MKILSPQEIVRVLEGLPPDASHNAVAEALIDAYGAKSTAFLGIVLLENASGTASKDVSSDRPSNLDEDS